MFNLKAFFMPRVLRFIVVSLIRILSVVALAMVIAAEIAEVVRNIKGYATVTKQGNGQPTLQAAGNTTITVTEFCGYVNQTSVPDIAGGIFFATFYRFMTVLVLLFLLVSEISLPVPAVYNFFLRNIPQLSEDASLGFLGAAMMWLATGVLSSKPQKFAMIAAWMLFILGFLNVLLSVILGPKVREERSIFPSDKSKRNILPTASIPKYGKKGKSKDVHVSYPAPIDIGFPRPAATSKNSMGLDNYNTAGGAADLGFYMAPPAPSRPSVSEMVERRAVTPVQDSPLHRSRSGKGVVTIKTDPEEIPDVYQPPSYGHGSAV